MEAQTPWCKKLWFIVLVSILTLAILAGAITGIIFAFKDDSINDLDFIKLPTSSKKIDGVVTLDNGTELFINEEISLSDFDWESEYSTTTGEGRGNFVAFVAERNDEIIVNAAVSGENLSQRTKAENYEIYQSCSSFYEEVELVYDANDYELKAGGFTYKVNNIVVIENYYDEADIETWTSESHILQEYLYEDGEYSLVMTAKNDSYKSEDSPQDNVKDFSCTGVQQGNINNQFISTEFFKDEYMPEYLRTDFSEYL